MNNSYKNKIIELEITDIAGTGYGVGKYQNITVFVNQTVIGDTAKCKIETVKKNYMTARLLKLVKPSVYRQEPPCPVSGICGGCQIQSLKYEYQLKYKENLLRENLKRIGGIENPMIDSIVKMDSPYNYRNSAKLPVKEVDGKIVIGFYKNQSHIAVDCGDCPVQQKINFEIIKVLKTYIKEEKIKIYDEITGAGSLRHIIIRNSRHTNQIMVGLVTKESAQLKNSGSLYAALRNSAPDICSLMQNINPKNTNRITGEKTLLLAGKDHITDTIGDLSFKIGLDTFYQVNSEQMEKLYAIAAEYAELSDQKTIYDLYCGIGTISLILAKKAKAVYGVEISEKSIKNAKENAVLNGISNAHFYKGKVEEILPVLSKQTPNPDVIVLDPARAGAKKEALLKIKELAPEKIIYISCNPSTLARDLALLLDNETDTANTPAYEISKITPVDMFPHTINVETIVLLSKLDSKKYISVELPMDDMDLTSAESKATYKKIQNYAFEKFGVRVSTLYIAQVKRKYGLEVREHYNISKNENQKVLQCPIEKEEAILDALKYFHMIN